MKTGSVILCVMLCAAGCRRESASGTKGTEGTGFTVKALTAERSGDFVHLTMLVLVNNTGPAPLSLTPPAVQLFAGGSRAVAPFIAPGLEPVAITPGAEATAVTHWWLAAADLSGSLELEINGSRATVKSTAAFAIDSLPESKTVPLAFPQWKAP